MLRYGRHTNAYLLDFVLDAQTDGVRWARTCGLRALVRCCGACRHDLQGFALLIKDTRREKAPSFRPNSEAHRIRVGYTARLNPVKERLPLPMACRREKGRKNAC